MKPISLLFAMLALPASLLAAQATGKPDSSHPTDPKDSIPVTVSAKGTEVRTVLMDIFDQEKKQYVFEPNIHFAVYLSLDRADFHRALDIVCTLSGLQAELKDGVYFVHPARNAVVRPVSSGGTPSPAAAPQPATPIPTVQVPVKLAPPAGPVPASLLQKHVTTRLSKTDIRALFADLSKQSGVKIVVDDKVPAYKLDAFLINTSLRYALTKVTHAAGLEWKLPANRTVLIVESAEANNVTVVH